MTQEDKQLVLKDICAKWHYGLVLDIDTSDWRAPQGHIKVKIESVGILAKDMSLIVNGCYYGDKYKPYLRPMSSMTEEEKHEFECYIPSCYWKKIGVEKEETGIGFIPICEFFDNDKGIKNLYNVLDIRVIDWLNAHLFDYRGLIEKGLALKAPKGIY